jgi:hypothetical protein
MRRVCAWCGKKLGNIAAESESEYAVSHGICDSCALRLLSEDAKPLHDFLDGLGVPVLVMESGNVVRTANRFARELLRKDLCEMEGLRGGNVLECPYAKLPGGCGQQEHCKSCTIRNCVLETFETGRSILRRRAYPDIQFGDEVKTMCFEISTEKTGDLVLLCIDEAAEEAGPR